MLTNQSHLETRGHAVYETWGHRCGRFIFVTRLNSSRSYTIFDDESAQLEEGQLPIQYIPTLPEENYQNLPEKVRQTLLFCSSHYPDYDWYLKADDDTFVIIENLLRFLISTINKNARRSDSVRHGSKSLLYGYRFREDHYVSGGGGYVLTRQAVELFSSHMTNPLNYSRCQSTMEDMMVGLCLQNIVQSIPNEQINVAGETVDQHGRERFHPLNFRIHFNGPGDKTKREWIHFRPFHHYLLVSSFFLFSPSLIYFQRVTMESVKQRSVFITQLRKICIKWIHFSTKFDDLIEKFVP